MSEDRPLEDKLALMQLLEERVVQWHRGDFPPHLTLREVLGMTKKEYSAWLVDAWAVPARPLPEI